MMRMNRTGCDGPGDRRFFRQGLDLCLILLLAGSVPVSVMAQTGPSDESTKPKQTTGAREAAESADQTQAVNPEGTDAAIAEDSQVLAEDVRVPKRRDRIADLIESLDPAALNRLLGAEVNVEVVGRQVILKGPKEAVKMLELLIKGLDQEIEQKVLRVVQVTERDAKEVARIVQDAVRDVTSTPTLRPEEEITITAMGSTILLVAALPKDIDWVVEVIGQVDSAPPDLPEIQKMTFAVKHRRAGDVATQLQQIIEKLVTARGGRIEDTKIQIIPNNANNTVMVVAPETERAKMKALIEEIDVEPVKGWGEVKLTIFPLLHSKADELGTVINDLLMATTQSQQQREAAEEVIYRLSISKASPSGEIVELPPIDLQKPMRIIPDTGTNSLIVATVEENVGPIGELIRLMDGVPVAESLAVRLFPLRFSDSDTLRDLIQGMFDQSKELPQDPDGSGQNAVPEDKIGRSLVYGISIVSDARTNTLIVSGRPEQMNLIETVVEQLDRPSTALKFPLRIIRIEHTDATRLSQLITSLFDKRVESAQATGANQTSLERERVFLSVDVRSNALIVSASQENFSEITGIVRELDTEPANLYDQIRVIACNRLKAATIKTKIDDLWQRKSDLRREEEVLEDKPVIVIDERSNSLIVASSTEDYEEIKSLVVALEARPRTDDTRLFKLKSADATALSGLLDQLLQGLAGQSEAFQAPTIIPDPRSNTLLVAAARDAMERVEELVQRLDVRPGPNSALFRVYPLKHASSSKLASRMQQLFDSRSAGQDTSSTPIVIQADESSNSLVCSASRDDHLVIKELLGLLDKPSSLARQFEIFPLKLAKATSIADKLESVFTSQADGNQGRADAIAVTPDERTNSLIVWAAPTEMANIAEVIDRLDTAKPAVEMMVKVIQLRQALASDFATLLTDTLLGGTSDNPDQAILISFIEQREDGTEILRKLLRQDISVQPDPRTNSLMVMAPEASMGMLEAMIHDFDQIRPVTSEVRLYPLINSDADAMVTQLTELFQPAGGGGGGDGQTQSQIVFGDEVDGLDLASVGQELRFASDPRTNTLIVAGAEVYLRMVEELVRYLDQQEAEGRVVEVYQAKYLNAQDLATTVQGFVEQEQAVLGATDDQTSLMRRQERQISIEALGTADEGSSQLVIGSSRRNYQKTMNMVHDLDRPEPQVMISVLIAEVSLNDSAELGIELAGQDLNFTDSAILGPNGVLQGSDFDHVIGTALGAAGTGLGLNYTITGEDFSFLFHALQTNRHTEVLSRPILLVRNGQEGAITIADQVPFVQSSQLNDTGSTNSVIGNEDVGIVLTVTPHISPDGYVTIALRQELSNFAGQDLQLTEGVSSPIFQTREVDTNVTVRDGETVVIGGLITSNEEETENKVPILGDLPLIGMLFRSRNVRKSKTELLIVLTVDILRTDEDIYRMSIEQRDKFLLPDSIRQSQLMEGLRIVPQEAGLGPSKTQPKQSGEGTKDKPDERKIYGPKPKVYGPLIKRPTTTSTAAVSAASPKIFGPEIPLGIVPLARTENR